MSENYETAVFALYRYKPSLAAAIVAIVLFIITTVFHTFQIIKTRTKFFIPLVIGGYFEWIGYIGRAMNSQETPNWQKGPYILQSILLLVAPSLFAATVYMTLGRIARLCGGEKYLLVRPTRLTKMFVLGDVCCFLIQSTGAGSMAQGTTKAMNTGEDIILFGLFLQIFFFCLFVVTSFLFHSRMKRDSYKMAECSNLPWQKHMFALYGASGLILVRSIYRIIEYLEGNNGYIMHHEWYMYVFDGLLMLGVLIIFNIIHGGELNKLLKFSVKAGSEESMYTLAK